MKRKITRTQFNRLSTAYRIFGFTTILGLLMGYSVLIGKPIEFICIFIPYFATKGLYPGQWHAESLKHCIVLSLLIFGFITTISLPKTLSIITAFVWGLLAAYISYHAGQIQFKLKDYAYIEPIYTRMTEKKPFDLNSCTEGELTARCRELRFTERNTELAVDFFIRKIPHKEMADKLFIDEKSVTTRKQRMKKKLIGM